MVPNLKFIHKYTPTIGHATEIYYLENFYVSPFSRIVVTTQLTDGSTHKSVLVDFYLPQVYTGKETSQKRFSAHEYRFTLELNKIRAITSKEELLDYVTKELMSYYECECKIPNLRYNPCYELTSSDCKKTIENYVNRQFLYTPLIKIYGEYRKKQLYCIMTSYNADCYFDNFLPLNFIMPKANELYNNKEIRCEKISLAIPKPINDHRLDIVC